MPTAYDHYERAVDMKNRIVAGKSNERPIMAWAAVARECAKSQDRFYEENPGIHGRRHQAFLTNLDRVWWAAKAQVETLGRQGA